MTGAGATSDHYALSGFTEFWGKLGAVDPHQLDWYQLQNTQN